MSQNQNYSPQDFKRAKNTQVSPQTVNPDFRISGKLDQDLVKAGGVHLKCSEPSDSAKPTRHWRLHVFKDDSQVDVISLFPKSIYRFGRNTEISDVILMHESCSQQHAVLQYRRRPHSSDEAWPYILDLDSTHGTRLNGLIIEPTRYVQLREKDILQFAHSSREYVLLPFD